MDNGTKLLAETLMELGAINRDLTFEVQSEQGTRRYTEGCLKRQAEENKKLNTKLFDSQPQHEATMLSLSKTKGELTASENGYKAVIALEVRNQRITILETAIENSMSAISSKSVLRKLKQLLKP